MGKRLNDAQATLAVALREQGASTRKAGKLAGCSPSSVSKYARKNLVPAAHVEAVKRTIRDKCAMLADGLLDHVTTEKMQTAPLGEITRSARHLIEMAGLAPPSIVETYTLSIQKYVKGSIEKSQEIATDPAPAGETLTAS